MPPIFKNSEVTIDDIGEHMKEFTLSQGISTKPRRCLIGSMFGEKVLLGTPLLKWYIEKGLTVKKIYQIAQYKPNNCFKEFGDSVSDARTAGDADSSKLILGQGAKLLGNSGYGKM